MSNDLHRDARTVTGQPRHFGDFLISGYNRDHGWNLKGYTDTYAAAEQVASDARGQGYTNVKITELEK